MGLSLDESSKVDALAQDRINIADHFYLGPPVATNWQASFSAILTLCILSA
jgi:hypothetical protein